MSSLSGLNAAPSTAIVRAGHVAAQDLLRLLDEPAARRRRLIVVDLAQEVQRLVDAELVGARHEGADVLGQAAAAEAEAGAAGTGARCGRRAPIASASATTSAPDASHTSAIALMNEILVARKAFAATLTSSAVARSVTIHGMPPASTGA